MQREDSWGLQVRAQVLLPLNLWETGVGQKNQTFLGKHAEAASYPLSWRSQSHYNGSEKLMHAILMIPNTKLWTDV